MRDLKSQRDKRQSWRKEHTTKNHMKTNNRPLQRAKLSWKQIMEVAVASFPQRRKSVRVNMKLLLSRLKSWIRRLLTEYYNEKDANRIFWKDIQRKGRDLFMLFGITNVSYFFNIEKILPFYRALVNIFQFWPFYINQALKWMKSIDIDERGFITEQVYLFLCQIQIYPIFQFIITMIPIAGICGRFKKGRGEHKPLSAEDRKRRKH